MTTIIGLIVSFAALAVAGVSLFVSLKQLHEAQTSNGGRGMTLSVKEIFHSDADEDLKSEMEKSTDGRINDYRFFILTYWVRGAADFYDVRPYTWADDGHSSELKTLEPTRRLTCENEYTFTLVPVLKPLDQSIKIGVLWNVPWRQGLRPGGVRADLNDNLEEWIWRPKWVARLLCIPAGYWRPYKLLESDRLGPYTQPWEQTPKGIWKLLHRLRRSSD